MLERARRWQAMPPQERARARAGIERWEHMQAHQREEARALFHYLRDLPREQRRAFLEQWLQAHPAPPRPAAQD